jgi:hypothetical protein
MTDQGFHPTEYARQLFLEIYRCKDGNHQKAGTSGQPPDPVCLFPGSFLFCDQFRYAHTQRGHPGGFFPAVALFFFKEIL